MFDSNSIADARYTPNRHLSQFIFEKTSERETEAMAPGDTTDPLRRSDPAVRVRGVATRAMHPDGAVHRDDPMRASTPGRLQGGSGGCLRGLGPKIR